MHPLDNQQGSDQIPNSFTSFEILADVADLFKQLL